MAAAPGCRCRPPAPRSAQVDPEQRSGMSGQRLAGYGAARSLGLCGSIRASYGRMNGTRDSAQPAARHAIVSGPDQGCNLTLLTRSTAMNRRIDETGSRSSFMEEAEASGHQRHQTGAVPHRPKAIAVTAVLLSAVRRQDMPVAGRSRLGAAQRIAYSGTAAAARRPPGIRAAILLDWHRRSPRPIKCPPTARCSIRYPGSPLASAIHQQGPATAGPISVERTNARRWAPRCAELGTIVRSSSAMLCWGSRLFNLVGAGCTATAVAVGPAS